MTGRNGEWVEEDVGAEAQRNKAVGFVIGKRHSAEKIAEDAAGAGAFVELADKGEIAEGTNHRAASLGLTAVEAVIAGGPVVDGVVVQRLAVGVEELRRAADLGVLLIFTEAEGGDEFIVEQVVLHDDAEGFENDFLVVAGTGGVGHGDLL